MRLRNLIYNLSLCVAGLMFVACNEISDDDRFIYVEPADIAKRVLLEDFTGQRCVNCPAAAELIEQIQEEYGADNVIAVGIYGGGLGTTLPNGVKCPLYTDEGQKYYDYWGVTTQPVGMVDRHGLLSTSAWPGAVYNYIQQKPAVLLDAECRYDKVSRNVDISVTVDGVESVAGNLQVWLVEDGVVSLQFLTGNIVDDDYVHNHVFRATVNGQMGDALNVASGERITREYSYVVNQDWNPENMSAVAFVYNDSGVLQVVKTSLVTPDSVDDENNV